MASKRTRAEYDELGSAARKWAAEAEHARQMVAALKQCMDTLQAGDWVGQGARAFYAEMNGQVMPALQRLVNALESASRTTQSISRAVHEAEQAAAGVLNGRDAGGALGAGGLAGALGLAGMAGIGALGGDFSGGNAGGGNAGGGESGPFSVSDFGVGDRIRTGGIDPTSSSGSSADSASGRNESGGNGGEANSGPFSVRDYGVGDPISSGAGAGGMNAAAAGATGGGGDSGGGSSGGGSSGGGGQPSGGGSGGGGDQAQQLDELDQALQSGDPQKIAAALKSQLLKGNSGAMEKFRRLSASMEMQVANAMLLSMSSTELTQLNGSPAMNELTGLRR